jgi:sulfatase maturation enzyme AslB (radical SAM superfamily)
MSDQFCRYLFNGYTFSMYKNKVNVRPCCLYKQSIVLDSQLLDKRQLAFESVTDWTNNCIHCKTLEDAGQQSLRQTGPDWIADDKNSQDPVTIDINLDRECNAACVTCDENSSSLWKKENFKLNNKKTKLEKNTDKIDHAIDQIVNAVSLKKLKYVKFFGGEPLFTDTHLKFIKHIPYPEQVTLHYTTNGSIYPNGEVLSTWKKFKLIIFSASLDGVKEQFDYVRWPLPWSKVSQNLLRLKNNKNIWNMMFRIEFTANLLNTYYFDRVEEWVENNLAYNLSGDKTQINIHPCWGDIWDLDKMPISIRAMVLEKYSCDHVIHRLVRNLSDPASLLPWKNFIQTWDCRRKNSWQTAFPDLVQFFD